MSELAVAGVARAAGQLDGAALAVAKTLTRCHSAKPYVYDPQPQRDERFTDQWNQGVNAEVFLHDPEMPARAKDSKPVNL